MDLFEVILLVAVMALAFVLRAIPCLKKGHYGNDSYYHMLVARTISKEHRLPEKDDYMVPEGTYGYPPLLHVLLAPFAWRHERFALRYLAPLIDTLSILVVYALADQVGLDDPIVPALIVAVSPMAVLQGASLNPRPIGNLALSFALLAGFLYWKEPDVLNLPFIVVAETVVMLSHKMSLQTLLVVHPAISIAAMWFDPTTGLYILLTLPVAFALAVIVTRGRYVTRVLKDHIGFIRVHTRHGDYATGRKGLPSPIRNLKSDPLSFAGAIIAIWWIVFYVDLTNVTAFLCAWSLGVFAIASFWPWGDAWRHMAFGTMPSALLVMLFAEASGPDWAATHLLVPVVIVGLSAATYLQLRRTIKGDQAARLMEAMKALPGDWQAKLKDAVVYSNAVHYSLPYELGVRCLGTNPNAKGIEVSFRMRKAGHVSLRRMAELTKELVGTEPQYFLLFEGPPHPDETGYEVAYDGPGLRIMVRSG